jgi:hypothetical protein
MESWVKNDLSMNRHRILEKAEIEGADFYTLYKNLNDWGRFLKLPKEYEDKNTKERPESAYLFLATKGNVMMYANTGKSSDRGFDVFKVIKDQKGLWTFPEALAEIINTSGDEAFRLSLMKEKQFSLVPVVTEVLVATMYFVPISMKVQESGRNQSP